jgi:hypothetical protein
MEEYKLRVSENKVLMRAFAPEKEEEVGGLEKISQRGVSQFVLFAIYY